MKNGFFNAVKTWFNNLINSIKSNHFFQRKKEEFITYIKSKKTKRKFLTIIITIAVIALLIGGIYLKDFIRRYPFSAEDYLIVSGNDISGDLGVFRLTTLVNNIKTGTKDGVRLVSYTELTYQVITDIVYDGEKLTMTTNNTKNLGLEPEQRIKTTEEFDSAGYTVEGRQTRYYLLKDGKERVFFTYVRQS